MESTNVAEALADAFVAEEVDSIFAYLGDGNMHFVPALVSRGVSAYSTRHENWAVAMADGYFRRTGRIGVASVTCGPGLTQIATSLMVARRRNAPLVILAGETPRIAPDSQLQWFEQRPFVEASGATYISPRSVETIPTEVHEAFYRARTSPGPVVIAVPVDFQSALRPADWDYETSRPLVTVAHSRPGDAEIARAAAALAAAERPVIVVGRGGTAADVPEAIEGLAEEAGALLATTLPEVGLFDGNPYALGVCGGYCSITARPLIEGADLMLAIGAGLNFFTTENGRLFSGAEVITVNSDERLLVNGARRPDQALVGDAGSTVAALREAIQAAPRVSPGYRTEATRTALEPDPRPIELAAEPATVEDGAVDPREFLVEIDDSLPDDCVVVSGVGHFGYFPPRFLRWTRGRQLIQTSDFGVIGQGISTAMGAALAERTPTVVFEGDASAMMALQELDTAARYEAPLLIVVMNDNALGAELHRVQDDPVAYELMQVRTPDLAEVARSFGFVGERIDSLGTAAAAIEAWARDPRPTLLDVQVSRQVINPNLLKLIHKAPELEHA
ncbi:MAG: thiamine pyrophosphate-binding protein [Solirubrobacterales bacterium]